MALLVQFYLSLAVTGLISFLIPVGDSTGTVVDLGHAQYRGNRSNEHTVAFLGLPYAEPPLNNLRWRAPLPLNTSRVKEQTRGKIVDATTYPEFCIQGGAQPFFAGGAGSEDCLNVNIWTPFGAKKGDNLPVLIYIHGGGYTTGNPATFPFDHWIAQSPNVVIVSIYYRLDAFGYLAHPAFSSPTPSTLGSTHALLAHYEASVGDHNAGFLDQIQAFHWVQAHISVFGGDPAKVTINGESAGASSVEMHLVAEGEQGLYNQAIVQSVYRTPLPSPEQQEPLFNNFATKAGCAKASVDETMMCLRAAPVEVLAPAQDAPFAGPYNIFRPIFDGAVLRKRPTDAIVHGKFTKVPLMVGATSNETLSIDWAAREIPLDLHANLKAFFPALTNETLAEYDEVYAPHHFANACQRVRYATGESELRCAVEILGDAYASAHDVHKVFAYRYNTPAPGIIAGSFVEHAADNWMMFLGQIAGINGTAFFSPMTPSQEAFASELIAYWLSFVRTGDPNTHKLDRSPVWPTYSTTDPARMVLTEGTVTESGSKAETIGSDERERCAFVASKRDEQQN